MIVFLRTTMDDLELPVAIADSTRELAEQLHLSYGSVASSVSRGVRGWYKVEIDEGEE